MCKPKSGSWLLVGFLCLACSGCGGCIKGKVLSFGKYDRKADSFSLLDVYANIATDQPSQRNHIALLWQRRENLLINPIDIHLFDSWSIFERVGKHSYRELPLGTAMAKEPETLTTAVDLDTIRVIPGEFFLNEQKNLCCYHEVVIPGGTVDAAMRELTPTISDIYFKSAKEEIAKARLPGSRQMSWNEFRKSMLEMLDGKPAKPIGANVRLPLEMASLRLLSKAGADKQVQFTRKADSFTLVVPLSERDANEAIATVDLARKTVAERLDEGKKVDNNVIGFLAATRLDRDASGLSVTLDFGKAAAASNADHGTMPPAIDGILACERTVAWIEQHGIPVNKTDQFTIVVKRFLGSDTHP